VQNEKSVAEHVAEFSQLYNTIGLIDDQEKVVKLWSSLRVDIRQEMYRKDLDPEVSSWDEVVRMAERAEVLLNLHSEDGDSTSCSEDDERRHDKSKFRKNRLKLASGGRVDARQESAVMRASSAKLKTTSGDAPAEKKRSLSRRDEMLAKGLCFNCEEQGHLARNCPKLTTMTSKEKGKPPGFAANGVDFLYDESALLETTEVLETLVDDHE
jgi:hypothetical protein